MRTALRHPACAGSQGRLDRHGLAPRWIHDREPGVEAEGAWRFRWV